MAATYGVIGLGGHGESHASAVRELDGVDLVAGADISGELVRPFAEEYDATGYTDHLEMLAEESLDAVSVCTPNGTHSEITVDAAEAGVNVLCAKPLDTSTERVDAMIAACERHDVTLGGTYPIRTASAVRRARDIVRGGELGEITVGTMQAKYHRSTDYYDHPWHGSAELDGGVLLSQAIHAIDLFQWIVGPVESVNAETGALVHDIETIDTGVATVAFENGARGTLLGSTTTYPQNYGTFDVHGTAGGLHLEYGTELSVEFVDGDGEYHDETAFDGDIGIQIRDFVEAVQENREPAIPGEKARNAVDIALACRASSERGERVTVDELR